MTEREIYHAAMHGTNRQAAPRLPRIEWAPWWDKTITRWETEGLPRMGGEETCRAFGLDSMRTCAFEPRAEQIGGEADYDRVRDSLFSEDILDAAVREAERLAPGHERGEFTVRFVVNGFFWYPRRLFGIEPHLLAFYDHPELMHRINRDLLAFTLRGLGRVFAVLRPDLLSLMEDMSYNHGPMLSRASFNEFLRPYYLALADCLRTHAIPFFVDTDGLVDQLVPWLLESGAQGLLPLERQSGVDVAALRTQYPDLLMLGGFDKRVLHRGEAAVRAEFERLRELMRGSGFVASVDHQTPPDVSLEDYRTYLRVFYEYTDLSTLH
ncbi:MAG: hypothetical protein LBJ11_10225 [Oscillospiraceae bacterium]|jgi:hypothetical protein|nr:hypothetical protein [Oscillospiraceae bacterium]